MHTSTRVIVLNTIPYSDSKYIINCYSEDKGKISFLHFKPKSKRSTNHIYFHPFALATIEFRDNEKKTIHTIHSSAYTEIHHSTLSNPQKQSIALFLSEILNHILIEEEKNPELFTYLSESSNKLNSLKKGTELFHHKFLIDLANFTGFFPDIGSLQHNNTSQNNTFTPNQSSLLQQLNTTPYCELTNISINKEERNQLLRTLILYYKVHFPGFKIPKTLRIFEEF